MDNQLFDDHTRPHNVVLEVSPELASQWLSENNSHNRKLVEAHVERLAHEMKAGRWQLTHQGIAFSTKGVLLDGQHRLWAIVMSETTVPMRVFLNQPEETLGAIDSIRARTNDEIITLAGGLGTVTRVELATLRAMIAGLNNCERRLPGEEARLLAEHRKAIQFAHEILPAARFRGIANAVTRSVLARASYSAPADMLRHFADVLQSGIASGPHHQPISLLFKFLIESMQGRRGRPEVRERYGKTQRALSAFLEGENLGRLYATTTELFPLPCEKPQRASA
jgi:hypothetical protein